MRFSTLLSALALIVATPCAPLPAADPAPAPAATRPNIVLIVSDDHSVPFLGAYGFPVSTPNLDRFAASGVLFDRMFVTAPQCAPSRVSFATGRSSVAVRASRFTAGLPRAIPTFPEILRRDAGYYTGICRRSHHLDGWHDKNSAVSTAIEEQHHLHSVPERFDFIKMGGDHRDTDAYVGEFLDGVPAGRPFFLWVNFNDPHHPWNDAPRVNDPAKLPLPADWPDLPEVRDDFARYLDEVARLDGEFKVVLDQLDRRHLTGNTLIVFVGDNGTSLPRGKGALHDRGLNVPLVVGWPGQIPPGRRSRALISGEDLAPTFLAAAGLTVPADMTGRSFLPLLRGDPAHQPRDCVFAMRGVHGGAIFDEKSKSNGYDLARMVRTDRYKLILNYTPWIPYSPVDCVVEPGWRAILRAHTEGQLAPVFTRLFFQTPRPITELYDLQVDPLELDNLAGRPELAGIERQLKIALQEKMITDYDYLPLPLRE